MTSYDIIGDIAIVKIKDKKIANSISKKNKNVKTVLYKSDIHKGKYRTQKLEYLAGEKKKKETVYKENNVIIKLNVEKVYFSPRLANEKGLPL